MSFEFPIMTSERISISTAEGDMTMNIFIILDFIQRVLGIWLSIPSEYLILQRLSAAMTNVVFILSCKDSVDVDGIFREGEPKKLLIRFYGEGIESILNRENELVWFAKLSDARAGPKLFATFENGRIEEYLDSVTLTPEMMRDPLISDEIARALSRFHALPVSDEEGVILWRRLDEWKLEAQKAFKILSMKKSSHVVQETLAKICEFRIFEEGRFEGFFDHLKSLHSPIVPGHNDLQHGNILLSLENEEIVLIDYEYGGMSYAAYDIANHFCEWASDFTETNPSPHIMEFALHYPSKARQARFIKSYLGDSEGSATVEQWMDVVEDFKEISHLSWAYWGIIQANISKIDFDYLGYSLMRLEAMRVI